MRVITPSGRELVALDADPSWQLKDILEGIPEQDRALDCIEHILIGTTELRPNMTLADFDMENCSNMLFVQTPVQTAEELEHVIRKIFSKASARLDYSKTYTDMVLSLRSRYPEFPPEHLGGRAISFQRILLNVCQDEFATSLARHEPTEEENHMSSPDEFQLVEKLKFFGHLFVAKLFAVRVIVEVMHDLTGDKDAPIEEHHIKCACELLKVVGSSLYSTSQGQSLLTIVFHRLMDFLKMETTGSDRSARIKLQIQDVIDLRNRKWQQEQE